LGARDSSAIRAGALQRASTLVVLAVPAVIFVSATANPFESATDQKDNYGDLPSHTARTLDVNTIIAERPATSSIH
jgi:hypothetical protein